MNDFLGNIYIYDNSEGKVDMFAHKTYFVELVRPDWTVDEIGFIKHDGATNRWIYEWEEGVKHNDAAASICLTYI